MIYRYFWWFYFLPANSLLFFSSLASVSPTISDRQIAIAYKRMFSIFEHAWYNHQPMFVKFEKALPLYQRALALGLYCKMLKPHTPLIPFYAYMAEESFIGSLDEFDYMSELYNVVKQINNPEREEGRG